MFDCSALKLKWLSALWSKTCCVSAEQSTIKTWVLKPMHQQASCLTLSSVAAVTVVVLPAGQMGPASGCMWF